MNEYRPGILAGGRVIPWERHGEGPAVLALTPDPLAARVWIGALAPTFRIVVPALSSAAEVVGTLDLAEIVEALGMERPALLADGALAEPVLRTALREPWSVRAIALVFGGEAGRPPGVPMRAALDPVGLPLLLLPAPMGATAGGGLRPLLEFLDPGTEAPNGPR